MARMNSEDYWCEIDSLCYEFVEKMAKLSTKRIKKDIMLDAKVEIGAEARELVISSLEKIGGRFPFPED